MMIKKTTFYDLAEGESGGSSSSHSQWLTTTRTDLRSKLAPVLVFIRERKQARRQ